MNNTLRQIESDDVIIYSEQTYNSSTLKKCKEIFNALVDKGEIVGSFSDDNWMAYSGLKHNRLTFEINDVLYKKHIGKEFGITRDTMTNMLKCYAIYCNGVYIYSTIAGQKINVVRSFIENYTDRDYKIRQEELSTIEDFLGFINTPEKQMEAIAENVRLIKVDDKTQRKLCPVINYMVIENEINSLYSMELDEKTFKKWFPIFFWVNITFILPLRATEMLITPFNCIERKDDKVYLKIRRTKLKKGTRTVYYDVKKDYQLFEYEIPETKAISIIEKYIDLTAEQDRRFLFEYNNFMVNDMLSLAAFNHLITAFMDEHIIGNRKYDFARYATNIKEFEKVTAGDSRPLAMANLYFQNAGEDICRQLANHTNINTSSGYYTNISETILNSSIMQLQKKLNMQEQSKTDDYKTSANQVLNMDLSVCTSRKREIDNKNLDDCVEQGHLEDCMGCKYYLPSKKELDRFLEQQKEKANESAKRVIEFMNNTLSVKNREISLEEKFLQVQTDATRYRMGCDIKAEEMKKEWQKLKSFQKTCC
jgi:hypothetical protein